MSISLSFKDNVFSLEKLVLPTRYYYFDEKENYIKLLSIGEGIFPKDKIKTFLSLENSNAVFTTESATKIYPSKKDYGINAISISLKKSNLEFLNDELILYKDAKLLQFLRIKADKDSTFFYADILSDGRSNEKFGFTSMRAKNSFYVNDELEYLEKYDIYGEELKEYIKKVGSNKKLFAKIYIKTFENESFLEKLVSCGFTTFTFSSKRHILLGVMSEDVMSKLKSRVEEVWSLYRSFLEKTKFESGKR